MITTYVPFAPNLGTGLHFRSLDSNARALEPALRKGLLSVGLLAALSVYSCLVLLGFIAIRIYLEWKRCGTRLGQNQYVVLVINLLAAGECHLDSCMGIKLVD